MALLARHADTFRDFKRSDRVVSVDKPAGVTGDEPDEIGLPADARLFEEAAEMRFDRRIGDPEISCNLPHAPNIDDRAEHAKLGRRELVGLADHL